MQQVQPHIDQRWPEALRDHPRQVSPFPWRALPSYLLPWMVAALLISAMFFYLDRRASQRIVFITHSRFETVRADGTDQRSITFTDLLSPRLTPPQWAPDGSRFASIIHHQRGVTLLMADPQDSPLITTTTLPARLGNSLFLPPQAWSPQATYLTVVQPQELGHALAFVDVQQNRLITTSFQIDPRYSPHWQPSTNTLLATILENGITSTLQLITPNAQAQSFTPDDTLATRSDGAWSPDGRRIAYIGNAPESPYGSLWVAQRDGSNPVAVVNDEFNSAPIWSPRGDFIFFSRLVTATQSLDLYRVRPNGQELRRIGPSTSAFHNPSIDRRSLLDWSPDRHKLFFQGEDGNDGATFIAIATYNGDNVQILQRFRVPTAVHWAPTSRALLIAEDQSSAIFLRWIDSQRPNTWFPSGLSPAWQPGM